MGFMRRGNMEVLAGPNRAHNQGFNHLQILIKLPFLGFKLLLDFSL
jgi:hypothetical protein